MKLHEYAEVIARLALECGDLEVWYASDGEGNRFYPVACYPEAAETSDLDYRAIPKPQGKMVVIIN